MHSLKLRRPIALGATLALSITGLAACSSSDEETDVGTALRDAVSASAAEQVVAFETTIVSDQEDLRAFLEANELAELDDEQFELIQEGRLLTTLDNGEDAESADDDLSATEWFLGEELMVESRTEADATYLRIDPENIQERFPDSEEALERLSASLSFDDTGLATLRPLLEGDWISVDTTEGSLFEQFRNNNPSKNSSPKPTPSPNEPTTGESATDDATAEPTTGEPSQVPGTAERGTNPPGTSPSQSTSPDQSTAPTVTTSVDNAANVSSLEPSAEETATEESDTETADTEATLEETTESTTESSMDETGESTSTNRGNVRTLLQTLIEGDASITSGDKEGPGAHFIVTVPAEVLREQLEETYPNLAQVLDNRDEGADAQEAMEGEVTLDIWVEDANISQLEVDLVQFAKSEDGSMVLQTVRQDAQEIEIPTDATELDVEALQLAFQNFRGPGNRQEEVPELTEGAEFGGSALEAATYLEVALTTIAQLEDQPASADQLELIQENIPEGVSVERSGENLEVTDEENNKACLVFSGEVGVQSEVTEGAC